MFGNKSGPSMVYEYGCGQPIQGLDAINEQLWLANRYRNRLTEIELRRRERVRKLLGEWPDADVQAHKERLDTLLAERTTIRERVKALRVSERRRTTPPEDRDRLKALGSEIRKARQAWKAARKKLFEVPEIQEGLAKIDADALKEHKEARAECGVYWATYLSIERAADQARGSKMDPRFRRFDGSGSLAVQLQGGLLAEEVFGEADRRFRIEPVPAEAWVSPVRSERRKLAKTQVWLRVGSNSNREPIWAVLPMTMHRPLPEESQVKWVHLKRYRVGTKWQYKLQITVELPEVRTVPTGTGVAAIDVGWRKVPAGLRVAYLVDQAGRADELVLPEAWLEQMDKTEELQSIRDQHFNSARLALLEWLDGVGEEAKQKDKRKANTTEILPDWLVEAADTLSQWRSTGRFARLVLTWRENRFEGDREIFDRLEAWRAKDKHLLEWQANLQDQLLRHRREIYRVFASELRQQYGTIVLKDLDLRQLARRDMVRDPENEAARQNRKRAAVSVLRQSIQQSGVEVVTVDAAHTTRTCSWCGSLEEWDVEKELEHTCDKCGRTWDQDLNSARNLLRLGLERMKEKAAAGDQEDKEDLDDQDDDDEMRAAE